MLSDLLSELQNDITAYIVYSEAMLIWLTSIMILVCGNCNWRGNIMTEYYQMTPKTCFLCKENEGMAEDGTPNHPAFKKCDHKIGIGILDLQIHETEQHLKELKRSKRYAKIARN